MSSWLPFILLILCFSFNGVSEARHRKHLHSPSPAAIVVGTVYCDTCFHQASHKSNHFISGAAVAVECGGDGEKPSFRREVKTNEKGEFEAKLPFSVSKHVDKIKGCSVRLISSGRPYCAVAATGASSEIRRKSKKAGAHVFSAGFFTFKPELCNQKDSIETGFPPSLRDPPAPFLPPVGEGILPPLPVPDLPIPPLVPPLPRLPGIPIPPVNRQKPSSESDELSNQKTFGLPLPPNPFMRPVIPPVPFLPSPPSLIPPLPFQPSPPSLIPPLPFQPSPPSLIPPLIPSPPPASLFPPLPSFPPVPGLIPSPPPPPPPAFPIPLPPLPPVPVFPGIPPAASSPTPKKTSP